MADGVEIWSGSAVLDFNSSGLCTVPHQPCLIALYCGHHVATGIQDINLAHSTDAALTIYAKYPHNPVIDVRSTNFRDPSAFWYSTTHRTRGPHSAQAEGHWLVVITHSDVHQMEIWRSDNLLAWKRASAFTTGTEGNWDCPDLFPLTLDATGESYWVMSGSYSGTPGGYWVGHFDGTTFTSLTGTHWTLIDYGVDSYAWITYNNAPADRRVMVSWMSAWAYSGSTPTSPWRGAATIPRELSLHSHRTSAGDEVLLIHSVPSPELYTHRAKRYHLSSPHLLQPHSPTSLVRDVLGFAGGRVYEVMATLNCSRCADPPCTVEFGIRVDSSTGQALRLGFTFTGEDQPFVHYMNRSYSGVQSIDDPYNVLWSPALPQVQSMMGSNALCVQLLVDLSSVEVFVQGGLVAATYQFFPLPGRPNLGLDVNVTRGEWTVREMDIWTYREDRMTVAQE